VVEGVIAVAEGEAGETGGVAEDPRDLEAGLGGRIQRGGCASKGLTRCAAGSRRGILSVALREKAGIGGS